MNELSNTDFHEMLRQRLAASLPGIARCSDFEPELAYGRHQGPPAHDARQAAVLLLVYPCEGTYRIPLTVRPVSMAAHGV
ncbi:MAG: hypothetical protein KDB05_32870, partial [Planctomycetales bacterium]|nr:hypothetical protein [Planctomycetales bacterium]